MPRYPLTLKRLGDQFGARAAGSCNPASIDASLYFLEFTANRRVMDSQVRRDLLQSVPMLSKVTQQPYFLKFRVVVRREPFQSFQFCKRSWRYVFGYLGLLVSRLAGEGAVSKDVSFKVFCRKLVPCAQRSRDDEH